MNLGDQIRQGSIWLLSGGISNRIMQFIFGVILARLLVPADFGMLVTVSIFTGIAGLFASGGLGQAIIRAKEISSRDYFVVFTVQLFIGILIYLFFYTIAIWFPVWFNDPLYTDLLRISALIFILRPFNSIPQIMLKREMRFKELAIVNFISMVISGILSVTMALLDYGVWSLVVGGLMGSILTAGILMVVTTWYPKFHYDSAILKKYASYGGKLMFNNLILYVKTQVSNFILSRMNGAEAVGIYNKAYSLNQLPRNIITNAIYPTLFRGLAKIRENKDLSKYMLYRAISLGTFYVIPFYVMMWWLAYSFILVVYGEKWIDAAEVLQILAITGILNISSSSGAFIEANNKVGEEIFIQLETLIFLVIGIFIGLEWGLTGVAWAMVINHFYYNFRLYSLASKCVGGTLKRLMISLMPAYVAGLLLFIWLAILHNFFLYDLEQQSTFLYFMIMGFSGSIVYLLLFLFLPLKEMEKEKERFKSTVNILTDKMSVNLKLFKG